MIRPLSLAALLCGGVGLVETVSSWSPYQGLMRYHAWLWFEKPLEYRMGLLRAQGSMAHPIYWGMSGFMLFVLLWSLRGLGGLSCRVAACFALAGACSSMSSGPILACMSFIGLSVLFYHTYMIKPILCFLFFAALFVEVASNRHFWNLVDYLALNSSTAWYRSRLMEVAVMRLPEYWLFGYGGHAPNHWAADIDGRGHTDVVNHFVILGLQGGVMAVGCYLACHFKALKLLIRQFASKSSNRNKRMLCFTLGAGLLALDLASMSVGLFGTPLMLSYVSLAVLIQTHSWRCSHQVLPQAITGRSNYAYT